MTDDEIMNLTENELLELLVNQLNLEQQDDGGYMTMREIARALGKSVGMTQKFMLELYERGLIESGRVMRKNIAGIVRPVPGYRAVRQSDDVQ